VRVSVPARELTMQAVVDRVKRIFDLNHPISDQEAEAIRREATEFAIDLLTKYRSQLAQRSLREAAEH
ncbi:MAG TPA: hypothetical protein VFQ87_10590, partial [Bradyrhizobium sp.]|nr:hypothetical protein [Bradyrhizobium sp.]